MKIEKLPKFCTRCTVEIAPQERITAEQDALKALTQTVHLNGFRPGKAPTEVVKEKVGADELMKEAVNQLLPSLLKTAMTDHELQPILPPQVQITKTEPLTLSLLFVEMPDVKVKTDKIELPPKPMVAVEQKEIDALLRQITWHDHTEQEVDRSIGSGDIVRISLETRDGKGTKVDALSADNARVIVGESSILPEVDSMLPGMKKGDEKTVSATLPPTFPTEQWRGRKVSCAIKIIGVTQVTLPALTTEYVKEKLKIDKTPDQLRADIEEMLRHRKEDESRQKREEDFFSQVRSQTEVELADELVANEVQTMLESFHTRLSEQKMTFEDWLKTAGKTPQQVSEEMKTSAIERLTLQLGIRQLIKDKGVTVDDADILPLAAQAFAYAQSQEEDVAPEDFASGGSRFDIIRSEKEVEKLMEVYGV